MGNGNNQTAKTILWGAVVTILLGLGGWNLLQSVSMPNTYVGKDALADVERRCESNFNMLREDLKEYDKQRKEDMREIRNFLMRLRNTGDLNSRSLQPAPSPNRSDR